MSAPLDPASPVAFMDLLNGGMNLALALAQERAQKEAAQAQVRQLLSVLERAATWIRLGRLPVNAAGYRAETALLTDLDSALGLRLTSEGGPHAAQ